MSLQYIFSRQIMKSIETLRPLLQVFNCSDLIFRCQRNIQEDGSKDEKTNEMTL